MEYLLLRNGKSVVEKHLHTSCDLSFALSRPNSTIDIHIAMLDVEEVELPDFFIEIDLFTGLLCQFWLSRGI